VLVTLPPLLLTVTELEDALTVGVVAAASVTVTAEDVPLALL
jgi:hypothetical protein